MENLIADSLHKLMHLHRSQMKATIETSGVTLSVSHIRALKCIKYINDCNASDIAHRLSLDKSQIARVLKELVNEKYVEKIRDPRNHRCQLLNLTNTGNELLIEITKLNTEIIENMTIGLTDKQIKDFIHTTQIMTTNLQRASTKSGA
ncbi:hypothetical protein MUS1_09680 [Marinomonas ushuaiensis DSM 15871]|uniref:HTH marR-type domain-containing protein n=1 Tax=Marinomonas ushuaiensis DSM 15871 TaxID=1122207 RepID=X7E931_9GAMM|nr:MarR family winged helix-turn-helix transcriptional regulator [Marinomonas ushuaiensis]ETX11663.1 hypothetical protein MUS1_09680 [Marinomonas ushuaiensis DSM 15871]